MSNVMPNTTQIPHIIIREWMPVLKDIELRILLVVADQTLGWIEDVETKRRKEKDWISHYQLRTKIKRKDGRIAGDRSVSQAVANMVDNLKIIEALNEKGKVLNSPRLRMKNGGRIYYRLSLYPPQKTLFATLAKSVGGYVNPRTKRPPSKLTSYKRNLTHKINTYVDGKPSTNKDFEKARKHKTFSEYFKRMVKQFRRVDANMTKSDGKNLKRVLEMGIDPTVLEKLSLYFLASTSFKKFSPRLSTFLSHGVLSGLHNLMKNDRNFWKDMDAYSNIAFKPLGLPLKFAQDESNSERGNNTHSITSTLNLMLSRLSQN